MLWRRVLDSRSDWWRKPMLNLIKSMISFRKFPTIAEVELDYLNASLSLSDLERRQREIERGLFRRSSFDF
jgi:hypothetical protein